MKLLLVSPGWPKGRLWGELGLKFPSLSLAAIAAATPAGWEVLLCDENLEPLNLEAEADLVGISAMTPQAPRAYEIAAAFRARGIPVVMGGFHASNLPDEALNHVDAVVVGEGEAVWPRLTSDLLLGQLQRIYRSKSPIRMTAIPAARRDIYSGRNYLLTNTIQTTRSCPRDSEFSSVTSFSGRRYREKPLDLVLAELETLRKNGPFVFFVDDNLVANRRYAFALFSAMRGMGLRWLSHSPVDFAQDPALMHAAGEAGCFGMFVGFESLNQKTLMPMGKQTNIASCCLEHAKVFRDHGIGIVGSFLLGCDGDTTAIFEPIMRFCEEAHLEGALFPIVTPYPGTRTRERLELEGRITSNDWRDYDMGHVTFEPRGMSAEELQAGHDWLNRSFYSFTSMYRRIFSVHRSLQLFGPMNVGFRNAIKRISQV